MRVHSARQFTRSIAEAVQEVRETVIHELGRYFGLDDRDMPHRGFRMRFAPRAPRTPKESLLIR